MSPMEIALLVIGVIIFVLSFLIPDRGSNKSGKQLEAEQENIKNMIQQEFDGVKYKVGEAADETVDNAVDKAERALEKTSNEKIMAVNEYGQTILEEINKNHQEVMFLYDMIKDKHTDLTNIVREADAAFKDVEALSQKAQSAAEGLRRELTVVSVTKKGLSDEQKAVFGEDSATMPKIPVAAQSYANQVSAAAILNSQNNKKTEQAVATDVMSGTAYKKSSSAMGVSPIIEPARAAQQPISAVQQPISAVRQQPISASQQPISAPQQMGAALKPGMAQASAADAASASGVNAENNNQRILELHNKGMSTVDIAKELKLGVGEVKLVLDLFR